MNQDMRVGEEYLMCERTHEQQHKKEITLGETPTSIKIEIKTLGLEVIVNANPIDCVILAGQICAILRASEPIKIEGWDKEPEVVILP